MSTRRHPSNQVGAEAFSLHPASRSLWKRVTARRSEKFIIGVQWREWCQDLKWIIAFQQYHLVVHPNDPEGLLSRFVDNPYVSGARGCHMKPLGMQPSGPAQPGGNKPSGSLLNVKKWSDARYESFCIKRAATKFWLKALMLAIISPREDLFMESTPQRYGTRAIVGDQDPYFKA